jgi:hypothetical protein
LVRRGLAIVTAPVPPAPAGPRLALSRAGH